MGIEILTAAPVIFRTLGKVPIEQLTVVLAVTVQVVPVVRVVAAQQGAGDDTGHGRDGSVTKHSRREI